LPKLKFLSLLIGFPILAAGILIPLVPFWGWPFYFLGSFVGLIGGYIFTRAFNYELCGIGFVIIGAPIYLLSMPAGSWQFLGAVGIDPPAILIARFVACLVGIVMLFASFADQ